LGRLACVEVPQLGLQLLLRRERDWRRAPAAVVADDRPLAPVLAANGRARRAGVAAGMRYATALALAPELRAAPVSAAELSEGSALVTRLLQGLSPQVEPRPEEPGTCWVGASGLDRLHGSLERWAESIVTSLHGADFAARIAVGFTRFGSYAAARARRGRGVVVLASPEEEQRIAFAAPLAVLGLAPQLEERFARLGVRSVEEFLRLPEGGLLRRFGPEAAAAHAFARGGLALPVQADPAPEPLDLSCRLPAPEDNRGRLLLHASALLDRLLADLHRRGELAVDLALELRVEGGATLIETLVPAEPTRSRSLLLELLDLRLASLTLGAGVERVALEARRVRAEDTQQELFRKQPRRDAAAGARAFARLRAELGNEAVVRARLADGHLPERQYAWEPAQAPAGDAAQPAGAPAAAAPCRVRRILEGPQPAAARPEATALSGGPYALSASWWSVDEADREYYFVRGAGGRVEWLYHDLCTRGWVLQGYVD
jgi:protein ImuB